MRILYTAPFLPYPPIDGGRIIPYHHLRGLSARGHELTMVFGLRRPEDRGNVPELERFGRVRAVPVRARSGWMVGAGALLRGQSVRVRRHSFSEIGDEFERALGDGCDVIYLDSLFTTYLLERVRRASCPAPVALFEHNVESQIFHRIVERHGGAWRLVGAWETPRVERAEVYAARSVDAVLTISEDDARALRRLAPGANAIPLGPGIRTFRGETIPRPPDRRTALFLGSYRWPPNRDGAAWLVREVWPHVRARRPDARLVLAGNDPRNEMREIAGSASGVEARGFVDDVDATTREAAVCLVPLRFSGGFRLKVIEALANERPVVSTRAGVAGMPFDDGVHLLVRDDPDGFAEAIVRLWDDPGESSRLARAGRAKVESEFSWDAVADRLVRIFEGLTGAR